MPPAYSGQQKQLIQRFKDVTHEKDSVAARIVLPVGDRHFHGTTVLSASLVGGRSKEMPRSLHKSVTKEEHDEGVEASRDNVINGMDGSTHEKESKNTRDSFEDSEIMREQSLWSNEGGDSGYNTRAHCTPEIGWCAEAKSSALADDSKGPLQMIKDKLTAEEIWSAQVGRVNITVDTSLDERLTSSPTICSEDLAPRTRIDPSELRRRTDHFWTTVISMRAATNAHQDPEDQQLLSTRELHLTKARYNERAEPLFRPVSDYHSDVIDAQKLRMSEEEKLSEPGLKRLLLDVYVDSALNYSLRDRARGQYVFLLRRLGITDKDLSAILEKFGIRPGLALGYGLWDPFAIEHAACLAGVEVSEIDRWINTDSERTLRHQKDDEGEPIDEDFSPAATDETTMFSIEEWHQEVVKCIQQSGPSNSSSDDDCITEELAEVIQSIRDGLTTWWRAPAYFRSILDMEASIDDIMGMLLEYGIEPEQWLGLYAEDGHKEAHIERQIDIMRRRDVYKSQGATNHAPECNSPSLKVDTNYPTEQDSFHTNLLNAIDDIRSGDLALAEVLELLKDMFGNIEMSDAILFAHLAEYDICPKQWNQIGTKSIHSTSSTSNLLTSRSEDNSCESPDLEDSLRWIAEHIGRGFADAETGSIHFKQRLGNSAMTDAEMHKLLALHGIQSRQLLNPNQESLRGGLRAMYNAFCCNRINHSEAREVCRTLFSEPDFELADLPDELNRRGLSTSIVPPKLYEDLELDMNDIQNSIDEQTLNQHDAFMRFKQAFEQRLLDPANLVPYLQSIAIPAVWIASEIAAKSDGSDRRIMSRSEALSKMTGLDDHADLPVPLVKKPTLTMPRPPRSRVANCVDASDKGDVDDEEENSEMPAFLDEGIDIPENQNEIISEKEHIHGTYSLFVRGDLSVREASMYLRRILGTAGMSDLDLAEKLKFYGVPADIFFEDVIASPGSERSFPTPERMSTGIPNTGWAIPARDGTALPVISADDFSSGMESQAPADLLPSKIAKELPTSLLVQSIEDSRSTTVPASINKGLEPTTPMMAEVSSKRSLCAKLRRHKADVNSWFASTHEDQYKRWKYQWKVLDQRERHFQAKTNLDYAYIKYGNRHVYRSAEDKQKVKAIMRKAINSFQKSLWGLVSSPTKAKELGLKAGIPQHILTKRFGKEHSWSNEQRIRNADTPCPPDRASSKEELPSRGSIYQEAGQQRRYGDLAVLKKWTETPHGNDTICSVTQKSCKRDASNPDPNDQSRKQPKKDECLPTPSPKVDGPDAAKYLCSPDLSPRKRIASNPDPNDQTCKQQKRDRSLTPAITTQRARLDGVFRCPKPILDSESNGRLLAGGLRRKQSLTHPGYVLIEADGAPLPHAFELLGDPVDDDDCAPLPKAFNLLEDVLDNARVHGLIDTSAEPTNTLVTGQFLAVNGFKACLDSKTTPDQESLRLAARQARSDKLKNKIGELQNAKGNPSLQAQSIAYLETRLKKLQFGDETMSDERLRIMEDATGRLISALMRCSSPAVEEPAHSVEEAVQSIEEPTQATATNPQPLARISFFEKYSNYTPPNVKRNHRGFGNDRKALEAKFRGWEMSSSSLVVERISRGQRSKADTGNENSYFGHQGTASSTPQFPASLHKLFDSYRDQPKDNPDVIGIEGAMQYLQALGINLDEVSVLVISEALQSPTMGEFTREGYLTGWQRLAAGHPGGAGTIANQSVLIGKLCSNLPYDEEIFKRVYNHTFLIARNPGQKAILLDTAVEYWRLLFTSPSVTWNTATTPWLDYYIEFLETKWKKGVNKDMWTMTLSFYNKTKEDEYFGWWSEDGAWPSVLDDFVRFVQEKRGNEGHAERMDVE
ncbi:MAG: Scaffold-type E3 ligase [Candelina submexicana]|nr:MAG: Scaffold-type E3 ligase [Candelina submexicana]